jgi:E3 ubiquitin ligase
LIVLLAFIVAIEHLTVVSLLAVAAGFYCFFRGLRLRARKRRQNAPASQIASALPGLVEVNGVATGPNTISAPITGQPCYLYHTTVWQQSKEASQEWDKVADETLHVPFFLNDSTGQLLIEPLEADVELQSEFHKEYDSSLFLEQKKVPQSVSLFLARHDVTPARRIRIEECCIRPESVVFIAGTVTENPGIEVRRVSHRTEGTPHLRRNDAPEVIRLSVSTESLTADAMTQQSKIAAALVKAGIQSPNAWDAAGVPCPETSLRGNTDAREPSELLANGKREIQRSEPQSKPRLTPALVVMKGPENAPFLISWRSRREVGRACVWQSAVMLCGGTVLTLAGLYVLLRKMHVL